MLRSSLNCFYYHRPANDAHLPKGPLAQLLHRNNGIKTFSVGAFNEASKDLLEVTKMCANVAADRALANGTAIKGNPFRFDVKPDVPHAATSTHNIASTELVSEKEIYWSFACCPRTR